MQTDVVVVGAGPVGLTLAIDLGQRGISCTLIDEKDEPQFLPKMERCNARTMEIFRRLGLADDIRRAGLDEDVPMDVFVVRSMVDPPLLRLTYPSVAEARAQIEATNDGSSPLEPYQLISQYTLEPLLRSVADALPTVDVRFGFRFVGCRQDEDGVTVEMLDKHGDTSTLRCRYLVGCDGATSAVRRQLGIKLRGEGNILKLRQALFHCPDLYGRLPIGNGPGKGRHYHVADQQATFLIMQDSKEHWTLHSVVERDEDMATQFEKTIGASIDYEMLYVGEWKQNLLLADHYGTGRVFLAGDAVHLVIPTGGLGMNTGVGDAIDLSWKLAATLQGWGGPLLLDSYEVERRQIGDRNIGASRYASLGRRKWRSLCRPEIYDDTPEGRAARDTLIRVADIEQRKTNEMIGAELGYRYVGSPIIWEEPGGPEHLFRSYVPTTWPGARLPHIWLNDGTPIQDRIGKGYTLLRLGGNRNSATLELAFRGFGVPLDVLDVEDEHARSLYGHDFMLLRPDMHIAWRGNAMPEYVQDVARTATGHGGQRPRRSEYKTAVGHKLPVSQ